jgi:hypothetical protein
VNAARLVDILDPETNYVPEKLAFLSTVMFSAGAKAIDPKGIVKITVRQTQ